MKTLHPSRNTSFIALQLFYIWSPLEGSAQLIPCSGSQSESTQPNNGVRNADLRTLRQMSGWGSTFPGSKAPFQVSKDHRLMVFFRVETGFHLSDQHYTSHADRRLFCRAIWRRAFPGAPSRCFFGEVDLTAQQTVFKKSVDHGKKQRFSITGEGKVMLTFNQHIL